MPFFFKLKAPHHAIEGFGVFCAFTVLPDWLAWETFGDANGVDDVEALRARLRRIREGARIEADPLGQIGCCPGFVRRRRRSRGTGSRGSSADVLAARRGWTIFGAVMSRWLLKFAGRPEWVTRLAPACQSLA